MLEDYESVDPLTYEMGDYGAHRTPDMRSTHFNQPIRFDIFIDTDEGEKYSGKVPDSVIFIPPYGLMLKYNIMEENFLVFNQEDTIVHTAYIVSPDDKYFEGYVFIPTPFKPKTWLDQDKSNLSLKGDNENKKVRYVKTYSLNSLALNEVNKTQRYFFKWRVKDFGGVAAHLVHKDVVNILKNKKRNIKFIPLIDYHIAMAMGGEDFPKSAI